MGSIERKRESQRIHQCLSSVSDVALLRLSAPFSLSPSLSVYLSTPLSLLCQSPPTYSARSPSYPTVPTFDLAGESLVLRRIRRRFL